MDKIKPYKLLVIDNYDSFTYNLVQMFMRYNLTIDVYRSDKISLKDIEKLNPDYLLISPGPKDPINAGNSISIIKEFYNKIPILGVCLGMQCINEAFEGKTIKAPIPMHGKTSVVSHNNHGIFKKMSNKFIAARYHSLMVQIKNGNLNITAQSQDNVIMGIEHFKYPIFGLQFHPESFLTENGFLLIENFLNSKQ